MKLTVTIFSLLCLTLSSGAQPYVDPVSIRYHSAFRAPGAYATPHVYLNVSSDLPLKLRENTYLLISPSYKSWNIDAGDNENFLPELKSLAFPAGIIFPLNKKWNLTAMALVQTNSITLMSKRSVQAGGVLLAGYTERPGKKWQGGVYLNNECFGLFVIPLLGTDWKINERNQLFGVLPGRFTWEHKWTDRLYGGFSFRSITSSFRLSSSRYVRIDDNQLSGYLDYYISKHWVITFEPGAGVFRRIRTGQTRHHYLTSNRWGNSPFISVSTAYRIRL